MELAAPLRQRDDGSSPAGRGTATTLDTYGHLWPDPDDSTRAAVEVVLAIQHGTETRTPEAQVEPDTRAFCGLDAPTE